MGSIIDSATTTVDTIKNSATLISEMVLEPIASICSWIKGGYGIFAAITKFLQDKQDKGEEK
jgi:hypothetical protein